MNTDPYIFNISKNQYIDYTLASIKDIRSRRHVRRAGPRPLRYPRVLLHAARSTAPESTRVAGRHRHAHVRGRGRAHDSARRHGALASLRAARVPRTRTPALLHAGRGGRHRARRRHSRFSTYGRKQ